MSGTTHKLFVLSTEHWLIGHFCRSAVEYAQVRYLHLYTQSSLITDSTHSLYSTCICVCVVWRNRNMYANLLLTMLKRGNLDPPFVDQPQLGPLAALPSHAVSLCSPASYLLSFLLLIWLLFNLLFISIVSMNLQWLTLVFWCLCCTGFV